ncbi:hypothetical protein HK098_008028 [Nowakowskiella sp. JEL0407]|nr:hypothetical protein HK098_008028 [Nowakowskiella sp. JEL0407]
MLPVSPPAQKISSLDPSKSAKSEILPFPSGSPRHLAHSLPLPTFPIPFPHLHYPTPPNGSETLAKTLDPKFPDFSLPPAPLFNNNLPSPFTLRRDSYPAIFSMQLPSDLPENAAEINGKLSSSLPIPPHPFDFEFYRSMNVASSISSASTRRPSEASNDPSSSPSSFKGPTSFPTNIPPPPIPFFFRNDFFQFPFSVPEYSSDFIRNAGKDANYGPTKDGMFSLLSASVPSDDRDHERSKNTRGKINKSPKKHRKAASVDVGRSQSDVDEEDKGLGSKQSPFTCETCGKAYKHGSCLAKHRWEHTDLWRETSRLSLSKHQQVQLLEAASILVTLGTNQGDEEMANSEEETIKGENDLAEENSLSSPKDENDFTVSVAAMAMVSMRDAEYDPKGIDIHHNGVGRRHVVESVSEEDEGDIIDIERISPPPEDESEIEIDDDYDMNGMIMEMDIEEDS